MLQRTNIIKAARDSVAKAESVNPGTGLEELAHAFRVLVHDYASEWDLEELTEKLHRDVFTDFPAIPPNAFEGRDHG